MSDLSAHRKLGTHAPQDVEYDGTEGLFSTHLVLAPTICLERYE